jgi:hypothetical protein
MAMTTIAVKINNAAHNDHGPFFGDLPGLGELPDDGFGPRDEESRSYPKDDPHYLAQFNFYFGMAYVLARIEEPWASETEWVETAKAAAIKVHRWGDTVGGRPDGES